MMSQPVEQSQGFLGQLDEKPLSELQDLLIRQEKLLRNGKFIKNLPDKGEKIQKLVDHLRHLIKLKEEVDSAADLMQGLSLGDEEMKDDDQKLELEGKDVNVIQRDSGIKPSPQRPFHPNRALRSNLGDLLEDIASEESSRDAVMSPSSEPQELPVQEVEQYITTVDRMSPEKFKIHESKLPISDQQPSQPKLTELNPSVEYTIVSCCLLPNRHGDITEICRVVAFSEKGKFSEYCIPSYVSSKISKQSIKISYHRGVRILTRDGVDTNAQPTTIVLKNFLRFLDELNADNIVLVTVGQIGTLLHNLKTHKIEAPDIIYANCRASFVRDKLVQYSGLPLEEANARILLKCAENERLELLNSCQLMDLKNADTSLTLILETIKRLNSFRGKLFDFSIKEKEVVTQCTARRMADSGLDYSGLGRLFHDSELSLVAVLVRCDEGTRVTRDARDIAAILKHFRRKQSGKKLFDAVLLEGGAERSSKLVPLEESLNLMQNQRKRMERIQVEQAKQRLTKNVNMKMTAFDPEASKSALTYRETGKDESESEDGDGVRDEVDSETEQDYPE